jgi:hypothetical protein
VPVGIGEAEHGPRQRAVGIDANFVLLAGDVDAAPQQSDIPLAIGAQPEGGVGEGASDQLPLLVRHFPPQGHVAIGHGTAAAVDEHFAQRVGAQAGLKGVGELEFVRAEQRRRDPGHGGEVGSDERGVGTDRSRRKTAGKDLTPNIENVAPVSLEGNSQRMTALRLFPQLLVAHHLEVDETVAECEEGEEEQEAHPEHSRTLPGEFHGGP